MGKKGQGAQEGWREGRRRREEKKKENAIGKKKDNI